jgi:hypothetical protein
LIVLAFTEKDGRHDQQNTVVHRLDELGPLKRAASQASNRPDGRPFYDTKSQTLALFMDISPRTSDRRPTAACFKKQNFRTGRPFKVPKSGVFLWFV